MDGVYDETTLLKASSVEPEECTPAAWNGIELPRPVPIHHIRGRLSVALRILSTSLRMGLTHTSHSQARYSRYSLFFCVRSPLRTSHPVHFLPNQASASGAISRGRLRTLTAARDTRMASLRSPATLTTTIVSLTANF